MEIIRDEWLCGIVDDFCWLSTLMQPIKAASFIDSLLIRKQVVLRWQLLLLFEHLQGDVLRRLFVESVAFPRPDQDIIIFFKELLQSAQEIVDVTIKIDDLITHHDFLHRTE